jgi:hypothetical protein
MNWVNEAKRLFNVPKPEHFTNYKHCCECFEHDEILLQHDVDSIGIEQLGNPGWDPMCFCSDQGFIYYMPALIRITLDTIDNPQTTYLDQMLFHLIKDGKGNRLVEACNDEQRKFVAQFLEYLVEYYSNEIEAALCYSDDVLKAHDIWS